MYIQQQSSFMLDQRQCACFASDYFVVVGDMSGDRPPHTICDNMAAPATQWQALRRSGGLRQKSRRVGDAHLLRR